MMEPYGSPFPRSQIRRYQRPGFSPRGGPIPSTAMSSAMSDIRVSSTEYVHGFWAEPLPLPPSRVPVPVASAPISLSAVTAAPPPADPDGAAPQSPRADRTRDV